MNRFSVVALPAISPQVATLHDWERLMRRAVDATRHGQAALAAGLYLQALAIAQAMIEGEHAPLSADDCMAAFVVTHLNMADLHRDADQLDEVVAHLCAAHHTLMGMLRDGAVDPALQQAAWRHSRETHAALLAHLGEHGSNAAIVAALRAGCMPFPVHGNATVH